MSRETKRWITWEETGWQTENRVCVRVRVHVSAIHRRTQSSVWLERTKMQFVRNLCLSETLCFAAIFSLFIGEWWVRRKLFRGAKSKPSTLCINRGLTVQGTFLSLVPGPYPPLMSHLISCHTSFAAASTPLPIFIPQQWQPSHAHSVFAIENILRMPCGVLHKPCRRQCGRAVP